VADEICSVCGRKAAGRHSGSPRNEARPASLARCRNSWCSAPGCPLTAVYSVGNYEGALRRAVVGFKYGGDLRWARTFAAMLLNFLARHATWFEEYGVICPVPSFLGAGARREFGHMELLGAELARLAQAGWPVEPLLSKVSETEPMSSKPHPVRRRIGGDLLSKAFRPSPGTEIVGRRVLVIDDVLVSGETLLAAAGALRTAGAEEVGGLVLARASWRSSPGAADRPRAHAGGLPALPS